MLMINSQPFQRLSHGKTVGNGYQAKLTLNHLTEVRC